MSRILIVEDDRDIRLLLAVELGGDDSVLVAESGGDALVIIEAIGDLAAVVTDLDLGPGPNGFDVLRAVRARNPACVRILITAQRGLSLDREASSLVDIGFAKPWPFGAIREYVQARLGA